MYFNSNQLSIEYGLSTWEEQQGCSFTLAATEQLTLHSALTRHNDNADNEEPLRFFLAVQDDRTWK